MVKKTTIGIMVGVLLLVTASAIVYARADQCFPGLMLGCMKAHMIKNLELTPDQVEKVEAIINEINDQIPDLREHRRGIHEELAGQFADDIFDQQAIKSTLDQRLVDQKAMIDFMITKLAEFHEILTPEQREKLALHMQEVKENRGCGHGPGLRKGRCLWGK